MAETIQYKCPCCGGRLEFDSGLQKMKCPYCDTTFDVETLEGYDDALKQDAADDMHWDAAQQPWDDAQMGVYTCKSCGGELVCDESTAATACPFCGNPIVLTGRLSGDLKPDYVIPFKLDKKAAEAALRNHMKGKRLLPNLCDIGMASREVKDSEKEQGLEVTTICMDGIAVVVNNDSTVDNLSLEQIRQIFTGEVTGWSAVK